MDTARIKKVWNNMNWLGKSMNILTFLVNPILFGIAMYYQFLGNENLKLRILLVYLVITIVSGMVYLFEIVLLDMGKKGLFRKD